MRAILVTYADAVYAPWQDICVLTGRRAGFDACHALGPADLDPAFARRHAATLAARRGAGYWLWKPWILVQAMAGLADGDVLVYADAATHFVNPIDPMIDAMARGGLDLLILGEGFTEASYTKRDAFVLMKADTTRFALSPQRFDSCFALRKSRWSERFLRRFLAFAEDPRILTDAPNACGLPNHPGFIAHRHDQSIFSLLSKHEQVPVVVRDLIVEGLPETGGQILNHTRRHQTPHEIVRHLLIEGVLRPADLPSLGASRSSA